MATAPESYYVLDGLLGNEFDLPVFEHATRVWVAEVQNVPLRLILLGSVYCGGASSVSRRTPGQEL